MSPSDSNIDTLHAKWAEAIRAGDVDRALELLMPDYVLWAAGAQPLQGRDAVRSVFRAALSTYTIEPRFESEERIVDGDLAFERGLDTQTVQPRAGGPAKTRRQRVFLILKRAEDGSWRYARGMSQPGPEPGTLGSAQ